MRISKANHLKQLLKTQDVLLGVLCFVLAVDAFWLAGRLSLHATLAHIQLAPIVLACCVFASITREPRIHGQTPWNVMFVAVRYTALALAGLLLVAFFGQLQWLNAQVMIGFGGLLLVGLLINRGILRWWYLQGRKEHPENYLKILVIGSGNRARTLMETYRSRSEWGIEIIGMLDPDPDLTGVSIDGATVMGGIGHIRDVLANHVVDEVIVCLPRSLINGIDEIVAACQEEAVCLKFLADVYEMTEGSLSLESIGALPVLNFQPVSHDETRLVVKRILDLLITIPALLLLLPFFGVLALAIKLDSPGPVFFVQQRVGLNKRMFGMIKFRSMFIDAEARLQELEHLNEADGPIFKIRNDPRVTRVGRFIRRASIDELPQLINVVLGHMSLVGPRPMSVRDVSLFNLGIQRRRFSVRPGLACLREISGRSKLTFERWLELDLEYIENWSLLLDLKILLRVLPSVLKGEGAS